MAARALASWTTAPPLSAGEVGAAPSPHRTWGTFFLRKWPELTEQEQAEIRQAVASARIRHDQIVWSQLARPYGADFRSVYRAFVHSRTSVRRHVKEVLASFVPDDTRSLTGVLCGDPLPGRSALDQERRAHA